MCEQAHTGSWLCFDIWRMPYSEDPELCDGSELLHSALSGELAAVPAAAYFLTCPFPKIIYFVVVSASSPIGPLA